MNRSNEQSEMINKDDISNYFKTLQDNICQQLEDADGTGKFQEDLWERPGGGGGRSRAISGKHIEKGGVNFSVVYGTLNEKAGKALGIAPGDFFATGVSIVLHPRNPMVPIIHMNVRYFEMDENVWWFGGGIDLTPHYIVTADARYFHKQLNTVCDQHDPKFYPNFKKWADDYFYIKHREETRGIGGIFFDRLGQDAQFDKSDRFAFVKSVGEAFCPIYLHFLKQNKALAFTEVEKDWQMIRRGRYVEFNLVWDRGTKFGLETNGRTESILMSMPPTAQWAYNHQVTPNSKEAQTLQLLKKGIDWVN